MPGRDAFAAVVMLPRDAAGFVRRGCPVCSRHFKVRGAAREDATAHAVFLKSFPHANDDEVSGALARRCPYCAHIATADAFLTPLQRHYLEQCARWFAAQARFAQLRWAERHLSENPYVTFVTVPPEPALPSLAKEPDDMQRLHLPCCAAEIKVGPGWTEMIFCPHCGRRHALRGGSASHRSRPS